MLSRKIDDGRLRAMINLMANDTKLKAISDAVGISTKTAYVWRMKIFAVAERIQESATLSGKVWIDEKLIKVNGGLMSRKPNGLLYRGVSRNQVCVACAVDANGNRMAIVAGKGHITSRQCIDTYGKHIAKGSTIIHDGIFSHDRLISFLGARSEIHKSICGDAHSALQPINSFAAEIEHFMDVHTGIRTEYLQSYMSWIAFRASLKGEGISEKIDELVSLCYQTEAVFKTNFRY